MSVSTLRARRGRQRPSAVRRDSEQPRPEDVEMDANKRKLLNRKRRHRRVRGKIFGTPQCPRLCVFRSAKHIYAQIVDDTAARTMAAASTLKLGSAKAQKDAGRKITAAHEVGKQIAEAAKKLDLQKVAFDRGGYLYHGRIAALADSARENGLKF